LVIRPAFAGRQAQPPRVHGNWRNIFASDQERLVIRPAFAGRQAQPRRLRGNLRFVFAGGLERLSQDLPLPNARLSGIQGNHNPKQ
jgi:hypothetical protein